MGWMVSAFIPEEVIDKIKASGESTRLSFIQKVAAPLVDNALKGIFRLNRVTGKRVSALLFEPLSLDSNLKQVSVWCNESTRPELFYAQEQKSPQVQALEHEEIVRGMIEGQK